MQGSPTGFWGKLRWPEDKAEPDAWHPLLHHCADVAACCEAMLALPVLRRRLACLAGREDIDPVTGQRLCVLAGLHDFGKVNHGFQDRAVPRKQRRYRWEGHVGQAFAAIPEHEIGPALDLAAIEHWFEQPRAIWGWFSAMLSHHGRPVEEPVGSYNRSLWNRDPGREPAGEIRRLVRSLREWFPDAFTNAPPFASSSELQHSFCGLLMLADWIGTDDERFFPFSSDPHSDRMPFARRSARRALRYTGLDTTAAVMVLGEELLPFAQACKYPPRPAQQELAEIELPTEASIAVLEDETGAGKTEAALYYFLRLFHARAVDGLYFALPTRSAATQIFSRVSETVARAFPNAKSRPPVVLAVPGYLRVDGVEGARLPHFRVLWPDDPEQRHRYRGWAAEHPKRYLAGTVVVGTIDQVLLSAVQVNHAHMRATALLRHLLVVDEVHASDAYMNVLLRHVLARHMLAGGHALLMSATLGAATRQLLLHPESRDAVPVSPDEASMQAYPSLSDRSIVTPRPLSNLEEACGAPRPNKRVALELLVIDPESSDPARPATRVAVSAARQGAAVLVIRNTVRDCVATQRCAEALIGDEDLLLRCRGVMAPHHSRFAREDRQLLDREIEARLGKDAVRCGIVAIATQTVQQSLDLDADLLVTDLCPMDVLLQRIGRLHRHWRGERPEGFRQPRVIVLVPQDRDLGRLIGSGGEPCNPVQGLGSVYQDLRIIEATWRQLEKNHLLEIPTENRAMVEQATHPQVLEEITRQLGAPWQRHGNHVMGVGLSEQRLAKLNLMRWDVPFADENCSCWMFPTKEPSRRITTRLGEGDRLVPLPDRTSGPFGEEISVLSIPAFLASEVTSDAQAEIEPAGPGALLITLGNRQYRYDRLGLRSAADDLTDSDGP